MYILSSFPFSSAMELVFVRSPVSATCVCVYFFIFLARRFCLRAWLHGEFQPGLKFRSALRAEILLQLHGQFQPGRKTLISVRTFTEVRKHNRYACSRSFFSPGWKNDSDYMDFSARAEFRSGLNPSPCNRQFGFQKICYRSRAEISARDEIRHVIRP